MIFAVAMTADPWIASPEMWRSWSAPMDSALRIDSVARSGTTVRIVTSPPWVSLRRRASSIADYIVVLVTQAPDTEGDRKPDPSDNTLDRAAVDPVIN